MDRHALSSLRVGGVTAAAVLSFFIACAARDSSVGDSLGVEPTGDTRPPKVGVSVTTTDTLLAEPVGMTKLTETGFNCVNGCGEWSFWSPSYANGATLVIDSTAPKSPGNVVRQTYTSELTAGKSPMASGITIAEKQTIYVAIWMQLSANFQGHNSGVNKVLHFFTAGGKNIAIFILRGSGTDAPLAPEILLQGIGVPLTYRSFGSNFTYTSTEQNLTSNPAVCAATRGKWTRYEMVLTGNAPGVVNGRAEVWMDGVKCLDVAGIGFFASDQTSAWKDIWWSPTWGGVGGSPSQTFSESVDHIYVSGK